MLCDSGFNSLIGARLTHWPARPAYARLIYDQTSSLRLDKLNGAKTAGRPLSTARWLDT